MCQQQTHWIVCVLLSRSHIQNLLPFSVKVNSYRMQNRNMPKNRGPCFFFGGQKDPDQVETHMDECSMIVMHEKE